MSPVWRAWHPGLDLVRSDVGPIDFFIVGMPKCGTTALDYFLRHVSGIQMGSHKELRFFNNPSIDWSNPDYRVLHQSFDWNKSGVLRGEATPSYAFLPDTIERIRAYNPNARLIATLRHPSYRAHSHWRMEQARRCDYVQFGEVIREGRGRVFVQDGRPSVIYSYVEQGFYYPQIRRMFDNFPRRNVLFLRNDWLWRDHNTQIRRITDFLGVDPLTSFIEQRYAGLYKNAVAFKLQADDKAYLDGLYEQDIRKTAQLISIDLIDWIDPEYRELDIRP